MEHQNHPDVLNEELSSEPNQLMALATLQASEMTQLLNRQAEEMKSLLDQHRAQLVALSAMQMEHRRSMASEFRGSTTLPTAEP